DVNDHTADTTNLRSGNASVEQVVQIGHQLVQQCSLLTSRWYLPFEIHVHAIGEIGCTQGRDGDSVRNTQAQTERKVEQSVHPLARVRVVFQLVSRNE